MKHTQFIKNLEALKRLSVDNLWLAQNKEQLIAFMRSRPASRDVLLRVGNALWWGMRPVVALVVIVVLVFGISSSVVVAARSALPTEPLYPVKITAEKLEGLLIFNDAKKINFLVNLAARRLQELDQTIQQNNGNVEQSVVDSSLRSYSSLIYEASKNIGVLAQAKPQIKEELFNVVSAIETKEHRKILNNIEKSTAPKSEALVEAKEASVGVDEVTLEMLKDETQSNEDLVKKQAVSQLDALADEIVDLEQQFATIKSIKGYLALIEADEKLAAARSLLDGGRRFLDRQDYISAVQNATDGLKAVVETKKLLIKLFGLEPVE